MPKVSKQHRLDRRRQVLLAARRCFARKGFQGTTMHDILGEADVSSGLLYGHFASKEDVILAIADENMGRISDALRSMVDPSGVRDVPKQFQALLELIRHAEAEDSFASMTLLVWSESTRNPDLAAKLRALLEEYRRAFATALGGGEDGGTTSDGAGLLLTSIVGGYILHLAVLGEEAVAPLPATVLALWPGARP